MQQLARSARSKAINRSLSIIGTNDVAYVMYTLHKINSNKILSTQLLSTMKFSAVLVALCVASSSAAPARRRTKQQHKSLNEAGARDTENYDPYLGVGRDLAGHEGSMSVPAPTPTPPPTSR